MTNDEIRMTNQIPRSMIKCFVNHRLFEHWNFEHSFVIRISNFVIRGEAARYTGGVAWPVDAICDAVAVGLRRRAADADLAQDVYGLDALDELGLHPLIQDALAAAGWGVWPEQRYP